MTIFFSGHTCKALARLLAYPDDALRPMLAGLQEYFEQESGLSAATRTGLLELIRHLRQDDSYASEALYVETFDRGRSTSLHLFEHVHGDSRERGQAMVDLLETYEKAGLYLEAGELPDYLPVALEFAATQPADIARDFLGEIGHILNTLHAALIKRGNPYSAVIAAVMESAGVTIQNLHLEPELTLDEVWAEPPAFDGCSTNGQNKPGQPQPIHIVRTRQVQPGAR